jgi:hypothetical protein
MHVVEVISEIKYKVANRVGEYKSEIIIVLDYMLNAEASTTKTDSSHYRDFNVVLSKEMRLRYGVS